MTKLSFPVAPSTRRAGSIAAGLLQTLSVRDLLTWLHDQHSFATVMLWTGRHTAQLHFLDGELVYAAFSKFEGVSAVLALAEETTGTFCVVEGPPPSSVRNVAIPTVALLLGLAEEADDTQDGTPRRPDPTTAT